MIAAIRRSWRAAWAPCPMPGLVVYVEGIGVCTIGEVQGRVQTALLDRFLAIFFGWPGSVELLRPIEPNTSSPTTVHVFSFQAYMERVWPAT